MNFKSFSKIAAVSAIALIAAVNATGINTAVAQYVIGTDEQVDFGATVDNTITVAVTPGDFGTIAVMNSTAPGDVAVATLPAGPGAQVLIDDHGSGMGSANQAHIVGEDAHPGVAAIVDVSNAFATEEMFVTFSTCDNLDDGLGSPELVLTAVTTSLPLATPYDCTTPMATGDTFTTDGAGVAQFFVGASIETDGTTNAAYPDGAYTGSVQMQITY